MQKQASSIMWLIAVVGISAFVLSKLQLWQDNQPLPYVTPTSPEVEVYLIGYNDEEFPGKETQEFTIIGCEDALVPYEIKAVTMRLSSVLSVLSDYQPPEGLHNPMFEKELRVKEVRERNLEPTIVDLVGEPKLGGICDTPRLKSQIEETIKLYAEGEYVIRLNGRQDLWECLGDVRGGCG